MKTPEADNLRELFERFMSPEEAQRAAEDVRIGDEILCAHPAREPDEDMILGLKLQIADRLAHRHRTAHRLHRLVAGVAAAIVLAVIVFHNQAPRRDSNLSHAALVPTFIWESDDLAADDVDLAYLTSEIREIEAQVRALEAGEGQDSGLGTLDEVEIELAQINSGFWKE